MDAVWTSVVAVVGTLLGAVVSYDFQRRGDRRREVFARAEAVRQERMVAYSGFAAAVEEYLRGQASRWYRKVEDPRGERFVEARDEAHLLRTAARQALYRVKLLTDDADVVVAAERAYRATWDVSNAQDQEGWEVRNSRARGAVEEFVARAAPLVR